MKTLLSRQQLWDRVFDRPVLPLALFMASDLCITYAAGSMIPSVILCAVICAGVSVWRNACSRYIPYFLSAVLISLCLGLIMTSRLDRYEQTGRICSDVYVVSADHKLNGKSSYTVRLDSGAYAVLYPGDDNKMLKPGSTVNVTGSISLPSRATNPGQFDYRDYLLRKGIRYVIYAEDKATVSESFMSDIAGFIDRSVFELRRYIFDTVTADMDEDDKAMTAALCLGDQSMTGQDVRSGFALTSCSHLIAVSGTHFSGFMALLLMLSGDGDRRKKHRWLLVAVCIAAAFMTGFRESVTRALVMSICMIFTRDRLSGMCTALVIMLAADPFSVMSSGLQLSMFACFGMLYWGPKISKRLVILGCKDRIADTLACVLASHIGLLPFAGSIGLRVSPVNLLCQIAGSLVVSIICIMFIPVILLNIIGVWFVPASLEAAEDILQSLISGGASVQDFAFSCGQYSDVVFIGMFIFAVIIAMPDGRLRKMLIRPAYCLLALSLGVLAATVMFRPDAELIFLDVGQGDSCLIMAGGHSVLIDGGTYEEGEVISQVLDHYGITAVDLAIVTHWDSDHCGGIAYLADAGRIDTVAAPSECTADTDEKCRIEDVSVTHPGTEYAVSDQVTLKILWPYSVTDGKNEDSVVALCEAKGISILFTGDIGEVTEETMTRHDLLTDCDILKVSHHGSRFSTSDAFLKTVRPEIAVISCGRNNMYGHPAGATLARLSNHGVAVRRTDLEGAVKFEIK